MWQYKQQSTAKYPAKHWLVAVVSLILTLLQKTMSWCGQIGKADNMVKNMLFNPLPNSMLK